MSWLGSTLKSIDTRKELVNYIGGNTQPSRAVVTNSGGEIDSSVVTVAELALLSGVSSNVQTQLTGLEDDKQDEITGAATTVTSNNLTSNRVLMSNASGKIKVSSMSSTTFDYLGVGFLVIRLRARRKRNSRLRARHATVFVTGQLGG